MMQIFKLIKFNGLLIFGVFIALTLAACQPSDSRQAAQNKPANTILRIGYIGPATTAGGAVGWALDQGTLQAYLKPLGFSEIKEYTFANGPDLSEALLSNSLDIGLFGDTPALTAEANRGGTTLIGFNGVAIEAWLIGRPEIKNLADLTGKNIGVPKGSYMHRYVGGLIKAGLLQEVKLKFLLPRDANIALGKGNIDAFAAPVQLGPYLQSLKYNTVDLASNHHFQGNDVIVARSDFLTQYPQFFSVFDKARREATVDLRQKPDLYYAYYLKHTKYEEAIIRASIPIESSREETYPEDGMVLLENTKKFLLSQDLIKKDFNLTDWQIKP